MTRREVVSALVAQRVVVVVLLAASLVITAAAALALPRTYTAHAVAIVETADPLLNLRAAYYSGRLIRDEHNPYVDYFVAFARDGSDALPAGDGGTAELISTSVIGIDRISVDVMGRSPDPVDAARAANRAATAFVDAVARTAAEANPRAVRAQVRASLDRSASPPESPSSPSVFLVALMGLVGAATVGVAGGLVAHRGTGRSYSRRSDGDDLARAAEGSVSPHGVDRWTR